MLRSRPADQRNLGSSQRRGWRPIWRGIATIVLCAPFAGAQTWEIEDEIEFAKSMARYRLFDLSSEYLDELGRGGLESADRSSLLYMRAFLFKVAGDYAETLDLRMKYLNDAVTAYDKFLEEAEPDHTAYDAATTEAAEVQRKIGALLFEQLRRGTAPPSAREDAEKAFRGAIKKLNDELARKRGEFEAWSDTREIGESEEEIYAAEAEFNDRAIDANQPLLELVATYLDFAKLYEPSEFNHKDYLSNCKDKCEEYLWEVSIPVIPHYQCYSYYGQAILGLSAIEEGDETDGEAALQAVLDPDSGVLSIIETNPGLPKPVIDVISALCERTAFAAMQHFNNVGKFDKVEPYWKQVEKMYQDYRDRELTPGDDGKLARIEYGRAKHAQGSPEGMAILQKIASDHAKDDIGAAAAAALTSLMGGSAGDAVAVVPASVWITAAEKAASEREVFKALENYHKALAASSTISDEAERSRTEIDCWSAIGRLYRGEGRLVEAILALEQAFAGCNEQEDVENVGGTLFNTLIRRSKETKDRQDERRKNDFMQELSRRGVPDMAFLTARDDFEAARILAADGDQSRERSQGLESAREQFAAIESDNKNYERAQIYLARCLAEQGKFDRAVKAIDDYFGYAEDAKNSLPSHKREERQSREIAQCEGTYYKSLYQAELGDHAEVQQTLEGFEERFGDQDKFFHLVNYQRLRSFLALEPPDIPSAEALYDEKSAAGLLPVEARYFLARSLLDKAEALETAEKADEAKPLRAKGAEHMYEYSETTGFGSYANLKVSGDSYVMVEEWENAAKVYAKILDVFLDDPKVGETVDKFVRRELVKILLLLDRFQEAEPHVAILLGQGRPDVELMRLAGICYGGRVDVAERRAVEVPGVGNYIEAVKWWDELAKGLRGDKEYTQAWWEAKFYGIYCRYRARDIAAEWGNQAELLARSLKSTHLGFIDPSEWAKSMEGSDSEHQDGPNYPFGDPMLVRVNYILRQLGVN